MPKELYIKLMCPDFSDEKIVLKEIRKKMSEFKCTMTECGYVDKLEKAVFKKATGGGTNARSIPPKYVKSRIEDDV